MGQTDRERRCPRAIARKYDGVYPEYMAQLTLCLTSCPVPDAYGDNSRRRTGALPGRLSAATEKANKLPR